MVTRNGLDTTWTFENIGIENMGKYGDTILNFRIILVTKGNN